MKVKRFVKRKPLTEQWAVGLDESQKDCVAKYRALAGLKDGDEITEDLDEYALTRTSCLKNWDKNDLRAMLKGCVKCK